MIFRFGFIIEKKTLEEKAIAHNLKKIWKM